jgi:hypothetical protein
MRKLIITLICILPFFANAQPSDTTKFYNYVGKNYRVPDSIKGNCSWVYAIISLKTNNNNKVVAYHFISYPSEVMKKNLDFLVGYQFSKKMRINGHSIIFYLLIDNSETCMPKPEDTSYLPDQIFSFLITNFDRILREDPRPILFSTPIISKSFPTMR